MRAIQVRGNEGPEKYLEVLSLVEKPKPVAGPGELLVHITLRPVNPADIFSIQGVYPGFQPKSFPATPGLEGGGVVEEVGEGVTQFKVGQRVVPILINDYTTKGEGSWQEYVAIKEDDAVAVPDAVTDESAAQFVVNPLTVLGMLDVVDVPAGEYLLQTAAGSVLGRILIAVAKHRGIKTINIVRRSEQKAELEALGADVVISSSEEDVVTRVKEVTGGKGAYAGLDAVGGETTGNVVSSLRDGGTVLVYGFMSGWTFQAGIGDILCRAIVIKGYWVTPYIKGLDREAKKAFFEDTMQLMEDNVIKPFTGEVVDLADFKAAVEKTNSVARGGKILLKS